MKFPSQRKSRPLSQSCVKAQPPQTPADPQNHHHRHPTGGRRSGAYVCHDGFVGSTPKHCEKPKDSLDPSPPPDPPCTANGTKKPSLSFAQSCRAMPICRWLLMQTDLCTTAFPLLKAGKSKDAKMLMTTSNSTSVNACLRKSVKRSIRSVGRVINRNFITVSVAARVPSSHRVKSSLTIENNVKRNIHFGKRKLRTSTKRIKIAETVSLHYLPFNSEINRMQIARIWKRRLVVKAPNIRRGW